MIAHTDEDKQASPPPGAPWDRAISAIIDHLLQVEDHQGAIYHHLGAIDAHQEAIDTALSLVRELVEERLP